MFGTIELCYNVILTIDAKEENNKGAKGGKFNRKIRIFSKG